MSTIALVVTPCRQETIGAAGAGVGDGDGLIWAPDWAGDGESEIEGGVATATELEVGEGECAALVPAVVVQPPTSSARATAAARLRIKQP
jgi:hypothetical protein